ncbi:hypothetical protein XELAEV_18047369mg [Xenopus laevis]|uniref:Uncharacterized protein n=1 Tax=Xenopus laevis TaxID=8355 RepID=A0A974BUP9_XENLA|nr:hypothetical protein XELAEV_18047369mg [Xenopus laevis]
MIYCILLGDGLSYIVLWGPDLFLAVLPCFYHHFPDYKEKRPDAQESVSKLSHLSKLNGQGNSFPMALTPVQCKLHDQDSDNYFPDWNDVVPTRKMLCEG